MISTQPFQTIGKCKCLGFEFITKKDTSYWYKNMHMISEILQDHIALQAVVHLNKFWLLFSSREDIDDILRSVTKVSSDLGRVFLSRIHMSTYIHETEDITFIKTIILNDAQNLFLIINSQSDMFTSEPKFESMREDLRRGLWIT
jgi:hypothetical protein